jgi:hypothetical protein
MAMPNKLVYPKGGAIVTAAAVQTFLALSVLKLFKTDLSITANTPKADLTAAEADYEGYTAKTITAWHDPYLDPGGGASIDSGEQIFYYVDAGPHTGNQIYGFWVEDAAGDVVIMGAFIDDNGLPLPVGMTENGDAVPVTIRLIFGAN